MGKVKELEFKTRDEFDQYIKDRNIANVIDNCPNHPCYCGACECEI